MNKKKIIILSSVVFLIIFCLIFIKANNGKTGISGRPKPTTVGSTIDEVLRIQGAPTKIDRNVWFYKDSFITFDSTGQTESYNNVGGDLNIIEIESE